jgi:hypothetical protein
LWRMAGADQPLCQAPDATGEVALADLAFPPDTETAWIHAACRHYLGLRPFPTEPRPDWTWLADLTLHRRWAVRHFHQSSRLRMSAAVSSAEAN